MQTGKPQLPSTEAIQRALAEFQVSATSEQVLQIQQYIDILLRWNEKMNLTAIRDPLEILYRHFCESMFGTVVLSVEKCRLADVGSGGGFPGIPMKIIRPEIDLFLIESNMKKATFLTEVVRELSLTGVRVLVSRYEELSEEVAPLDIVCSRAVGEFGPFLEWASLPVIGAQKVGLWIGAQDAESVRRLRTWSWEEPKPIPHSLRRFILVGTRPAQ
ncbi:MAG: 16S rRNA (guanine(527)-N(7))-methyltransferase RsmG [Acidobacteria bacterium]|nr:16S rRNA (guanine(527)-N(7))-methyltransferase RsmG [Acidobacteriota bacterium]MBS1864294.1 16S rRNA (guanine(527)-N(7))-methyltransferase RsmG [Acidobacteriota bacterium]